MRYLPVTVKRDMGGSFQGGLISYMRRLGRAGTGISILKLAGDFNDKSKIPLLPLL